MIQKINNRGSVLLVDDDRSVTQMLSMLLETRGYDVSVANSGRDAFRNVSRTTDLIILDLVLPDEKGFDICQKLKKNKETRNIPIIILSARSLSEDIIEGLYLGADDYLTKPFEYEELIARMEAVMRRRSIFYGEGASSDGDEAVVLELRRIIDEGLIVSFFQPIFFLKSFRLLGFEALSRLKIMSVLTTPEQLFKSAIQFGVYQELEVLAWKNAIKAASEFLTDEKIFLNCNPYLIEGPKTIKIKSLFNNSNIKIKNVILEITERSAVSDFDAFYERLKEYREYGFKFAVDDVGGGYASLETIVQMKPEVVKIDRHIICRLEKDAYKKSIVKFIVSFCKENNVLCIAEGIETKAELDAAMALGVDAGQGYYLYRPVSGLDLEKIKKIKNFVL